MVHNGNAAVITAVNKKKGERLLMKIKKRFLGILLSLALMLGMMPGMSLTAYADEEYLLYVGGIQVTKSNASNIVGDDTITASYVADTKTLTLNGFNHNDYNIMSNIDVLTVIINGDTNTEV